MDVRIHEGDQLLICRHEVPADQRGWLFVGELIRRDAEGYAADHGLVLGEKCAEWWDSWREQVWRVTTYWRYHHG